LKAFGYLDITIAPDAAGVIGRTAVSCPGPVPAPADEIVSSVCGRAAAALWIDHDAASMRTSCCRWAGESTYA
jgi:hypothetical protein